MQIQFLPTLRLVIISTKMIFEEASVESDETANANGIIGENLIQLLSLPKEETKKLEENSGKTTPVPIIDEHVPQTSKPPQDDTPPEPKKLEIVYNGRDILNLQSNIEYTWPFQPSTTSNVNGVYKFSEVNNRYTTVRRMRDVTDGEYYYCFPFPSVK